MLSWCNFFGLNVFVREDLLSKTLASDILAQEYKYALRTDFVMVTPVRLNLMHGRRFNFEQTCAVKVASMRQCDVFGTLLQVS